MRDRGFSAHGGHRPAGVAESGVSKSLAGAHTGGLGTLSSPSSVRSAGLRASESHSMLISHLAFGLQAMRLLIEMGF